jgi:hypothetical protein
MKVTSFPYDWISPTLTWIIFMWSIYLEELSFIHVVNVNPWSRFFYINIVHCTLLIPIKSSTFIYLWQFHPYHLMSIMLSISSKWQGSTLWSNFIHVIKFIQMVIQNLHGFHMYNLISFMAISYSHQCHSYGNKWLPVNSIQFPLFTKWTVFFPLFHHG